ncbi:MAG: FAD-binding oxidoreductase [Chitinophagales bacterium]|nr:FAD-binding oxidoreductase [Chitinophagales bacterium]
MQISDTDWWKWGAAEKRKALTHYPKLHSLFSERFSKSFTENKTSPPNFNAVCNEANEALVKEVFGKALPSAKISFNKELRLKKALGKSYADLLKALVNIPIHLPDAVVSVTSHNEVVQILQTCSDYNIQVVPFGGGSNVVGAFNMKEYSSPRIVLDMAEMKKLLLLDEVNHTAVFEAGIYGPELEATLNAKGFTMGHFPQSFEYSTLGGWIVTRSAGQESSAYGRIEDIAISLKVATPGGTLTTSSFEGDAEGVNLKAVFFGSEGMFGVITEAKVRIHRLPETKKWLVAVFPSFENGTEAIKQLVQKEIYPSVIRYSDEHETFFLSQLSHETPSVFSKVKSALSKTVLKFKGVESPSLMMIRLDGEKNEAELKREIAMDIVRKQKGFSVGESLGKKWETSRFGLPYLRDDLMERGIFVDTMETVLPWNKVVAFKKKLFTELQQSKAFGYEKGILLAHLSHVYTAGTSIYFTVITARDEENPYAQWEEIKKIVTDGIVSEGGAVSHHHSIGRDHQHWYVRKTDALTQQILRSIKQTVDPNNILNPGKLFDE